MSYELLSEQIRKYVRDKRWESLRPIQAAAISRIITTNENYILASKTASGKTEAAFLPILSKLNFNEEGVQVLYISPLIALINDQFYRIEELCKYLDVEVTKWHGEASKSLKGKLIKNPRGVVLITPESLEAMFINAPYNIARLFSNLKYIVIDEIHSFIGTDRGIQLKSIISRLQQINISKFNIIGLSATIGDYNEAKRFTGDENNTKVLLDRSAREMISYFRYFEAETSELPINLLKDLYIQTKDNKVLIFPNSRGRAEEIAVKLKKISDRVNGHPYYFSHHSSVDKELREYVEHFAKSSTRNNFCICCTSTLELGIDIGTVDEVVQIDATYSIASLIQRVGRSGRQEGEKGILFLYATDKWSLLQSLACWLLYQEGFIEPLITSEKSYDLLLHQILSIVKQFSGCYPKDLIARVKTNFAFTKIPTGEIEEIIEELIEKDLLELIQGELILGIEGEKVVNSRDFYSVFKTEPNFKVINFRKKIGEIPFSPQVIVGENILLAAKIWKMVDIDVKFNKIEVIPALDGKKPLFFGTGGVIHPRIREKMLAILMDATNYIELDEPATDCLKAIRQEFANFKIESLLTERPIISNENKTLLYSFQGTKINRSLFFLLNKIGINCHYNEHSSTFELPVDQSQLKQLFEKIIDFVSNVDLHLEDSVRVNPALLDFSKWASYLPIKYQCELLKEKYFDFKATKAFLESVDLVKMIKPMI
jgi:ATP-dependent Lhr-like helicase